MTNSSSQQQTTSLSPSRGSPNRNSLLMTRSPASIPSSPTSVHSGTSAIFERDIEPISVSPPSTHPDPHRTARGHNSEALEQSVPSVLDAAVEALSHTATSGSSSNPNPDDGEIAVIAPNLAFPSQSSSTSPRSTSRSPSPGGPKSNRASTLLNLPHLLPQSASPNLTAVTLPPSIGPAFAMAVSSSEPVHIDHHTVPTITPFHHSTPPSASSSPGTATDHVHPTRTATRDTLASNTSGHSPTTSSKRLSFISYTDILTATPSSSQPLSSLTTSITSSSLEPPSRSLIIEPEVDADLSPAAASNRSLRGRKSNLSVNQPPFLALLNPSPAGEWEREGFGLGLEERLEMASPSPVSPPLVI